MVGFAEIRAAPSDKTAKGPSTHVSVSASSSVTISASKLPVSTANALREQLEATSADWRCAEAEARHTERGLAVTQSALKAAGLHLTICVEQVAASGGYMMACVADRIVASPFAVVNLRDLHANPHPHAHIHVCFELVCRCSARSA